MVNKEWLYRKILQNIGLNTLHQQLLMKKSPENFIILIKKEYSKYDAIYVRDGANKLFDKKQKESTVDEQTTEIMMTESSPPEISTKFNSTTTYETESTWNVNTTQQTRTSESSLANTVSSIVTVDFGSGSGEEESSAETAETTQSENILSTSEFIFAPATTADSTTAQATAQATSQATTQTETQATDSLTDSATTSSVPFPSTTETLILEGSGSGDLPLGDSIEQMPVIVEGSAGYSDRKEQETSSCDCKNAMVDLIEDETLITTLTKLIRSQVEREITRQFQDQLNTCQNMVSLVIHGSHLGDSVYFFHFYFSGSIT